MLKALRLEKFEEIFQEKGFDELDDFEYLTVKELENIGFKKGDFKKWKKKYLQNS